MAFAPRWWRSAPPWWHSAPRWWRIAPRYGAACHMNDSMPHQWHTAPRYWHTTLCWLCIALRCRMHCAETIVMRPTRPWNAIWAKSGRFKTSNHSLSRELVSEQGSEQTNERSGAPRWSKQDGASEWVSNASKWTSKGPNAYISMLGCSELLWNAL